MKSYISWLILRLIYWLIWPLTDSFDHIAVTFWLATLPLLSHVKDSTFPAPPPVFPDHCVKDLNPSNALIFLILPALHCHSLLISLLAPFTLYNIASHSLPSPPSEIIPNLLHPPTSLLHLHLACWKHADLQLSLTYIYDSLLLPGNSTSFTFSFPAKTKTIRKEPAWSHPHLPT